MTNKMKKFFDFDVKAVEGEANTFWFTASTDSRDRQGDIIVQQGWRTADFMKNPVILWGHNYYETPIGKAVEIAIKPDSLDAKIQFVPESIDPFAGKVAKLVAQGYLKTVSVGFTVYKSEPLNSDDLKQRPEMKYGQRLYGDLLEISIVPVPANPEALNQNSFSEVMARGFGFNQSEAQSKFLPYRDEKGAVSPRLLRASVAAAMGARGGIQITDADHESCLRHLRRIADENDVALPDPNIHSSKLHECFPDVWHHELLDVINNAQTLTPDVSIKLINGKTRSQLVSARDAINTILELSETEPVVSLEPTPDEETADILKSIVGSMGEITAKLK